MTIAVNAPGISATSAAAAAAETRADSRPNASVRPISSQDLLAGRRVLIIQHNTEEYRLQITRSGKLILTK